MSVGRGRGPHQIRNYLSRRPPVQIKKEIPYCQGWPVFLATRRAFHDPLPVVVANDASQWEVEEDVNIVKTTKQ